MAAPHPCSNCQTVTTADRWFCDDCQAAVNAAVRALGPSPSFVDVDVARQTALAPRSRAAAGTIDDPMRTS